MNFAYPLCGSDRILQKASCASDIAVWELFWALGSGATAVLGCPDRTSGLDHFINLIHAKAVTVVQFTWAELNQLPASLLKTPGHLNGLEHIFCIGEMADIAAVNSIKNLLPKVEIHRLYGCSETAINVLSYDFTGLMDVCIGKPISNIRAYVLDQKLRPMPIGVKGQLYISGVGLARGSVRHWHANETRFMANPFQDAHDKSRGCYERLYRTGDMARWLANGNLEFLGRETSQPKLDQSGSGLESV
jgi:non-ribosomal peptide synthetase component F